MARYTASELRALPTLSIGQADDLKIDKPDVRVWLSRCSVEDGEPYDDKITVEYLRDGRWIVAETYPGSCPDTKGRECGDVECPCCYGGGLR